MSLCQEERKKLHRKECRQAQLLLFSLPPFRVRGGGWGLTVTTRHNRILRSPAFYTRCLYLWTFYIPKANLCRYRVWVCVGVHKRAHAHACICVYVLVCGWWVCSLVVIYIKHLVCLHHHINLWRWCTSVVIPTQEVASSRRIRCSRSSLAEE